MRLGVLFLKLRKLETIPNRPENFNQSLNIALDQLPCVSLTDERDRDLCDPSQSDRLSSLRQGQIGLGDRAGSQRRDAQAQNRSQGRQKHSQKSHQVSEVKKIIG